VDELLLRGANTLAAEPWGAAVATALSSPWMLVAVALPLLISRARARQWRVIVVVALTVGAADMVSSRLIKPAVGRERPCRALDGLVVPVSCGVGRSFPSSHAANGFALATAAAPTVTHGWVLFPLAAAVALSRVVLGVHYPSDVLAGALLGVLLGFAGRRALRSPSRSPRSPDRPSPTAPDPPSP
jgi:undecaprenyl-diphosphatase